ncbi:hypothetical protein EWI07_05160 [Sporolactobacillus sp. THM7-4]|nr:hypothetical protein EWI07_05160 [Sporolactobacillus sp. THM7-4]
MSCLIGINFFPARFVQNKKLRQGLANRWMDVPETKGSGTTNHADCDEKDGAGSPGSWLLRHSRATEPPDAKRASFRLT